MNEELKRWLERKCCCRSPDARECFEIRYLRSGDFSTDDEDAFCDCCCHDEVLEDDL